MNPELDLCLVILRVGSIATNIPLQCSMKKMINFSKGTVKTLQEPNSINYQDNNLPAL
jgi:hypothetical protein